VREKTGPGNPSDRGIIGNNRLKKKIAGAYASNALGHIEDASNDKKRHRTERDQRFRGVCDQDRKHS
jgi:hypothetical protein